MKASGPARVPIQIRETVNGGITLAGVTEAEVRTKEEMASYLTRGSFSRATGSTNMNSQSRSYSFLGCIVVLFHDIFCQFIQDTDFLPSAVHMLYLQSPWSKRRSVMAHMQQA